MQVADYRTEAIAYLRKVVAETGKTPTELARLAGVNQTTFTRPLNNPDHKYAVKFQALQDLAAQTGVSLPESLVASRARGTPGDIRLAIRFEVGAGGFHERDELPQRPYGYRTVQGIPPYTDFPQWLERVVSDSMDRIIPVGSLLHVVDSIAIRYEPRHDDIVVVNRTRGQGSLVERTVKRVKLTPAGPELWPESHNARWAGPILLTEGTDAEEDLTVEITGLVLRSYQFFVGETEEPEAA